MLDTLTPPTRAHQRPPAPCIRPAIARGFEEAHAAIAATLQKPRYDAFPSLDHIIVTDTFDERGAAALGVASFFVRQGVLYLPYEETSVWETEFAEIARHLLSARQNIALITNYHGLPSLATMQSISRETNNGTRNFVVSCESSRKVDNKAAKTRIQRASFRHISYKWGYEHDYPDALDALLRDLPS